MPVWSNEGLAFTRLISLLQMLMPLPPRADDRAVAGMSRKLKALKPPFWAEASEDTAVNIKGKKCFKYLLKRARA